MSEINNIYAATDLALLRRMGAFIKHHRLDQNKTQQQLSEEAGINRTTLVEFEKGKNSNLLTFIQLLRSLQQLQVLEHFKIETQISPLLLAEMEHSKRKRASKTMLHKSVNYKKAKAKW